MVTDYRPVGFTANQQQRFQSTLFKVMDSTMAVESAGNAMISEGLGKLFRVSFSSFIYSD